MVHGCVLGNDAVIPPGTRLFNVVRSHEPSPPGPLRISLRGQGKTASSSPERRDPNRRNDHRLADITNQRLRLV